MGVETGNTNRINYKGTHDFTGANVLGLGSGGGLPVFNVRDYGAVGNNTTDDSASVIAAIAAAVAAGGGIVYFPPTGSKYLIPSQLAIPYTGTAPPKNVSLTLMGGGASHDGEAGAPNGGSQLNLTYNGAGVAKIDTRGLGLLTLCGLTLMDTGSDTKPFIQTTNTTLHVVGCEFYGTGAGQDAIVLGGTSSTFGDAGSNSAFQGYGTVIERNYFNKISRGVYFRAYANAVVVRDNTWWATCSGNCAIELAGTAAAANDGNTIADNLFEMVNYTYGILGSDYTQLNTLIGNKFYDPGSGVTANICWLTSNCNYNLVIGGFDTGVKPHVLNTGGAGGNTTIGQTQGGASQIAGLVDFIERLRIKSAAYPSLFFADTATSKTAKITPGYASQMLFQFYLNATGSDELMANIRRIDSATYSFEMQGSAQSLIEAVNLLRVRSGAGNELWLGDATGAYGIYIVSGVPYLNGIATFNTGENHKFRSPTVNVGGTTTVDFSTGQLFFIAMGAGNTTVSPSNIRTGLYTLDILQDATGSRLITWQSQFKFPGGTAPALSTGAGKRDVFVFQGDQNYDVLKLVSYQLDVR